ncbi:MAG: hypothetical protein E7627_01535 [Ruminococcaceae bacterium]|nr:hypothetical protein [Oscillospiraceae bacterium]
MTKKIICLLIAMIMVLGMFAGCSNEEEEVTPGEETADTESSRRVAMTLSLWLPTDESTTEEAKALVEEAINKITQAKYNTAIELHLISRDEYKSVIDEKIEEVKKANADKKAAEDKRRKELKKKGQKVEETEAPVIEPDETIVDDLGVVLTAYPEIEKTQLDIFFVSGAENYSNYAYSNAVLSLDGELSGNSKVLKSYVHPTFFKAIYDFGTFAVPNNNPAGQYQYLLINKELVDTYDYSISDLSSLMRCENFIIDIGNQKLDNVIPFLGPVDASGIQYWSPDGTIGSEWSLLASQLSAESEYLDEAPPALLLDNQMYTNTLKFVKKIDELGYMGDGTLKEGQKFAVGVITGDASTIAEYEDEYYVSVYASPIFDTEDVYGGMFSVSTYTKNISRSMEIITCINTDKELRTILQYGVEGVHWAYEDSDTKDTIKIISDDYGMRLNETGNVFMTYPGEGISMDYWKPLLTQNNDAGSSPYMKLSSFTTEENEDLLKELAKLNAEYKAKLDALTSENFNAGIKELKNELLYNEIIVDLLDEENEDSLLSYYNKWQKENY